MKISVLIMDKKTKACPKSSELISILTSRFGEKMNLARIRFFGLFICALCKVQIVTFEKLAAAFESTAECSSSLRRIQRFIAKYPLDTDEVARMIFSMLPHEPPFTLSIDRTNWKFGQTDINCLVVAVAYKGLAFPVLYKLLPKAGNSNTGERIEIIKRFIALFGRESIGGLVADREFVGFKWLEYLNNESIEYHIRIKENFYVTNPRTGEKVPVKWLFMSVEVRQYRVLHKIYYINNQLVYLSGSKVFDKNGKPEMQILVSFKKPDSAHAKYKERWQIESVFRALKTGGFNIEDTHLTALDRIDKLFAMVIVAFTWSYLVGLFLHENLKPIRMLNHGYKAKSFAKHGLIFIASILLNTQNQIDLNIFRFLSCS